jgi:predicted nucleic acid-binding protein
MGSLIALTGTTVYLDTNLFIYAMEGLPPVASKLATLFHRFDRGELHAVTSELSLAEVLVKPIREHMTAIRDQYERMISPSPSLDVVSVNREILLAAATLRATSSLKLPDAVHAATSITRGCTTYLTNDHRFATIPDLPVLMLADLA